MRTLVWLAAVLAVWPMHAASADGWDILGPAQLGQSRDTVAALLRLECSPLEDDPGALACQPVPGSLQTFAGVTVQKLELTFRENRLVKVAGRVHESQFESLEQFVTQREGAGRDCSYVFRGGMGAAEFVNRILLWRTPDYALVIQQFQGKIDRSAFSYGTRAAMAELIKEKTAYPSGSRRDL